MKEHPDYKYRPRRKPKPSMVHSGNKTKSENPKFPFNSLPTSVIRAMDSIAARGAPFFSHHPPHPHHLNHHHNASPSSHHVLPPVPTLPVPLSTSGGGAQATSTSPAAGGLPNFSPDFSRLFPPFIPSSLSEALFSRLANSVRMGNGSSAQSVYEEEQLIKQQQQQLAEQRASSMSPPSASVNGHPLLSSRISPKLKISRSPSPAPPPSSHSLSPFGNLESGALPFSHYPNGSYSSASAAAALYSGLYPSPYFHYSSLSPFLGHPPPLGANNDSVSSMHPTDLTKLIDEQRNIPKKSPVYVVHKSDRQTPSPVVSVV